MRRIHRGLDREDLVKLLTSGDGAPFKEIWRLLLFSATLGFKKGLRIPLADSDAGRAVPDAYFANCQSWPGIVFLFGLVETDVTDILLASETSEELLITIFEEYANGGLSLLQDRIGKTSATIENIVSLIIEESASLKLEKPQLSDIAI